MSPDQAANPFVQMVPFLLIMGIFYVLVIQPEQKKQKQQKALIANVKKNDQIITSGGIHGTVVNVKQTTVSVRVDDNTKLEIEKDAITTVKQQSNS